MATSTSPLVIIASNRSEDGRVLAKIFPKQVCPFYQAAGSFAHRSVNRRFGRSLIVWAWLRSSSTPLRLPQLPKR